MTVKQPRGAGEDLLYLDFDGVTHPENVYFHPRRGAFLKDRPGHALFEHAGLLESLLAPYPQVRIVLSTSWVLQYRFAGAAKRLPAGLRARCIGGTFHSAMDRQLFLAASRGMQVWSDVRRRQPRAWLALDDDYLQWPAWCRDNLVRTDEFEGLAQPAVLQELTAKLARFFTARATLITTSEP